MNIKERQQDILRIIEKMDISPTMFNNAVQKYTSIAQYLNNHGIEADIYPQGSFALGTVVRPYSKDGEKNYDLDLICQVNLSKDDITPSDLRNRVLSALNESDLYGGKLVEYAECFTIEYADVSGIGFSIDIVPAVDESVSDKAALSRISKKPDLISSSIAIPKHSDGGRYSWITNNPHGYKKWFDEINSKYHTVESVLYRYRLFEDYKYAFASVEEIPMEFEKTALQRVIQILKYHRNVYYSRVVNGDELKPISAVISTIVAEIAKEYSESNSQVDQLLKYVLSEFEIYSKHLVMSSAQFTQQYGFRSVITHENGQWFIGNPANPADNLADAWNSNPEIPKRFFAWISVVKKQLVEDILLGDDEFRSAVENAFGSQYVEKAIGSKYVSRKTQPVSTTQPAKPWSAK